MKKTFFAILALAMLASCAVSTNHVLSGAYTEWKDRDPMTRVDNSVNPTKKGKACMTNILGLISQGDSSVESAKKDGQITKVAFVDTTYKAFQIYVPFFQEGCTVVHGN